MPSMSMSASALLIDAKASGSIPAASTNGNAGGDGGVGGTGATGATGAIDGRCAAGGVGATGGVGRTRGVGSGCAAATCAAAQKATTTARVLVMAISYCLPGAGGDR